MIEFIIKYFMLTLCTVYSFYKLLNLKKPSKTKVILYIIFALTISFISYIIRSFVPYMDIVLLILCTTIFLSVLTQTKLELSIITTIISYGISNFTFVISTIVTLTVFTILLKKLNITNFLFLITIETILQLLLIGIPYRFKRLKKGMPFLINKGANNLGISLSVILLSIAIVITNFKNDFIFKFLVISILLLSTFVFVWWRSRIKNTYLERLKKADLKRMEDSIAEKENRIHKLEEENQRLAKIIHKDNKLIPAMELAVKSFIELNSSNDSEKFEEEKQAILSQLSDISSEHLGIVEEIEIKGKNLPTTDVYSIDTTLNYMLNRAKNENINFDVTLSCSVKHLTEDIISATDLNTLLADLIENAVIATKNQESKSILVNFGIYDENYFIDILDSGIPFEINTLLNLGIEKASTHLNDGGSGIGLMQTYEIKNKYKASIIIEEFENLNNMFSKKVSIMFDSRNKYVIKTTRANEIINKAIREDLIVVDTKNNYAVKQLSNLT